ncbi:flagellar hook-length control protein FliK [Micavibrio aeruginosavorus]|uniref:Flagellar hook-length control domain protein n=1 Tax=Micavibrio aeruginosavorus (strain ARL-13) TaxID=856793 RepID=G2KRT1_MICAA|nr:flagellar hook-length control protein FliK [Micavibrio aeruginosavorus]AEP10039.1 flagellar hook-length control domain protein [Micavibrio aeruginosavorus ARL-13]
MTTEISMQITPQARQSALTGAGLTGSGLAGNGMGGALSFIDLIFTQISPDGGMALTQESQKQNAQNIQDGMIDAQTVLLDTSATTIINTRPTQINADTTLNTDQGDDVIGMLVNDAPLSEEAAAFLETLAQALRQNNPDAPPSNDIPRITELTPESRKTLLSRLETLIQGLPLDDQTITLPKTSSDTLSIDAQTIADAQQALIATGLTPEDITKIVQDIHDGRDLTNETEGAALLSVIINILPPQSGSSARKAQDIVIMPRSGNPVTNTTTPPKSTGTNTNAGEPTVQSSLNDLLVNPEETTFVEDDGLVAGGKTKGFDEILRLMEAAQSNGNTKMAAGLEKALAAVQSGTSPSAALSAQGMDFMNGLGSLINDGSLDGVFPDGAEWARNLNGLSGLSITGTASLTSLVTSSANPAAPHPATQAVAIAITKTAQANSDSTLSMRLDPPDLGKLEVHVRFSKDKSMKAHMVIEKPETFLMLQRDSSVLERSLQEAGIDTGNGGLSFELADQSHDWSRDGNGRGYEGGAGRNGKGADDGEQEIVIESTMNWYTDAATGMQRYDILA